MRKRLASCTVAASLALVAAPVGQDRATPDVWNRRAAGVEYQLVLEVSGRDELG